MPPSERTASAPKQGCEYILGRVIERLGRYPEQPQAAPDEVELFGVERIEVGVRLGQGRSAHTRLPPLTPNCVGRSASTRVIQVTTQALPALGRRRSSKPR